MRCSSLGLEAASMLKQWSEHRENQVSITAEETILEVAGKQPYYDVWIL